MTRVRSGSLACRKGSGAQVALLRWALAAGTISGGYRWDRFVGCDWTRPAGDAAGQKRGETSWTRSPRHSASPMRTRS